MTFGVNLEVKNGLRNLVRSGGGYVVSDGGDGLLRRSVYSVDS